MTTSSRSKRKSSLMANPQRDAVGRRDRRIPDRHTPHVSWRGGQRRRVRCFLPFWGDRNAVGIPDPQPDAENHQPAQLRHPGRCADSLAGCGARVLRVDVSAGRAAGGISQTGTPDPGKNVPSAARLPKPTLPLQLPAWADRPLRYVKYFVLAGIIIARPSRIYPPLHSFCPARAVFSFKLTTGLMWGMLVTFIVTSLLVERVWCKYLCRSARRWQFLTKSHRCACKLISRAAITVGAAITNVRWALQTYQIT